MIIYPAVDIKDGRCVRLRKGELDEITDYGAPQDVAAQHAAAGAEYLHVVDLDGAFGLGSNVTAVSEIIRTVGIPVQVGGGIRTRERIQEYLDSGAARVVLGTAALKDPDLAAWAAAAYPGQVAAGLDAREGRLAVQGWTEQSDTDVLTAARRLSEAGVSTIIYTDISRDGMMSGPNVERTRELVKNTSAGIIGSGGVARLEDVAALRDAGAAGCIVGRALLDGVFTLTQAIDCGRAC